MIAQKRIVKDEHILLPSESADILSRLELSLKSFELFSFFFWLLLYATRFSRETLRKEMEHLKTTNSTMASEIAQLRTELEQLKMQRTSEPAQPSQPAKPAPAPSNPAPVSAVPTLSPAPPRKLANIFVDTTPTPSAVKDHNGKNNAESDSPPADQAHANQVHVDQMQASTNHVNHVDIPPPRSTTPPLATSLKSSKENNEPTTENDNDDCTFSEKSGEPSFVENPNPSDVVL